MPKKSTKLNKEETEKLSFAIDETKTFLNISQFYYEVVPTNKTAPMTAVWARAALKRTQNSSTRLFHSSSGFSGMLLSPFQQTAETLRSIS